MTASDFIANFLWNADAFEILVNAYGLPALEGNPDPSGELCIPWDDELWDWCNENPELASRIGIPGIYWFRIGPKEEKKPTYIQSSFQFSYKSKRGYSWD